MRDTSNHEPVDPPIPVPRKIVDYRHRWLLKSQAYNVMLRRTLFGPWTQDVAPLGHVRTQSVVHLRRAQR